MISFSKKLVYAILLCLSATACITLADTYVNMIFLTAYSTQWLSYFYVSQAIFLFVATSLLMPMIKKSPRRFPLFVFGGSALLVLLYVLSSGIKMYWLPFMLSVFLSAMKAVWGVTMWNVISSVFDIREFKKQISIINVGGSVGVVVLMLLTPFLITAIGSIAVPYEIILVCLSCIFFAHLLFKESSTFVVATKKPTKKSTNLEKPLLKRLLFLFFAGTVILFIITVTLLDYSLKLALSTHYTEAQIGSYTSVILSISSALTIIFGLFVVKRTILFFGAPVVALISPLLTALSVIAVIIHPSLFTVSFAFIVNYSLMYSFNTLGSKLVINSLPISLASIARMRLTAIAKPLGFLLSAVAVWVASYYFGLRITAVIILVVALLGALFALRLFKYYQKEIQRSIDLQRFHSDLLENVEIDESLLKKITRQDLEKENTEVQQYVIALLLKSNTSHLPASLKKLVFSQHLSIRQSLSILFYQHPDVYFASTIMSALLQETEPDLIWSWTCCLVRMQYLFPQDWLHEWLDSDSLPQRAAAILVLMQKTDAASLGRVKQQLDYLLSQKDDQSIYWNLKLMAKQNLNESSYDYMAGLLQSSANKKIQKAALAGLARYPAEKTAELFCSMISVLNLTHDIAKRLHKMGDLVLPYLDVALNNASLLSEQFILIKVLCQFNSEASRKVVVKLLYRSGPLQRYYIAHCLAFYHLNLSISSTWKAVVYDQIYKEVKRIEALWILLEKYEDEFVKTEIRSRLYITRRRYLYWLSMLSDSERVLRLASSFKKEGMITLDQIEKANALELLDTLLKDRKLAKTLTFVFEESVAGSHVLDAEKQRALESDVLAGNIITDPWLIRVIKICVEGGDMRDFYRIAKLRKVGLFKALPAEILQSIAETIEERNITVGDVIMRQGDDEDGLYMVASGSVEVERDGEKVTDLQEGAYFGELALIDDAPRAATVRATADGVLFYLDRNVFVHLCDDLPEVLRELVRHIVTYIR